MRQVRVDSARIPDLIRSLIDQTVSFGEL